MQKLAGVLRVTAPDCVTVGLPTAEFCVDLTDSEFLRTPSAPVEGCYLSVTGPAGTRLRLEVTPCAARTREEFVGLVSERLAHLTPYAQGASAEVPFAGTERLAVTALTGEGAGRTLHCGVLVVDARHASNGLLVLFSAVTHDDPDGVPAPGDALCDPRLASVARSFWLGATPRTTPRPPPIESIPTPSDAEAVDPDESETPFRPVVLSPGEGPRSAEIEYTEDGEHTRRPLGAKETLGRARDNTLVINDTMTSKHHAVIEWTGQFYALRDLGSVNGTRVDGRIVRGMAPLHNGSVIELGRTSLRFSETSRPVSQGLHDLVMAFEHEGLALPPIPSVMTARLRTLGPWFFSTDPLPAKPLHGDLGASMGGRDYLVVCYGANGASTASIQYCLGLGPLRIALECAWGGTYTDKLGARQMLATSFQGARALIGAAQQAVRRGFWPAGVMLDVRALQGKSSFWSPVGRALRRRTPTQAVLPPPEVLSDALGWVQGL